MNLNATETAKRYLESNKTYVPFGTYEVEERPYTDGSPSITKTFARFPGPIADKIRELATASGWDGCHWSDPLLISVDDTELREYEEEYSPPHCW